MRQATQERTFDASLGCAVSNTLARRRLMLFRADVAPQAISRLQVLFRRQCALRISGFAGNALDFHTALLPRRRGDRRYVGGVFQVASSSKAKPTTAASACTITSHLGSGSCFQ